MTEPPHTVSRNWRATRLELSQIFGQVLRALRKERSLSQEQLAFDSDLNRQFVSLLELGERSPSLETLYKLAKGLSLSGSELLAHVETGMAPGRKRRVKQQPKEQPRTSAQKRK